MDRYIGRLLDNRYEILEIIGTGGMAVVYKARCHRLNRLVAIKILKDEFARDEEFRRRFHAEGEAVAMLSHPNIVQVYDVSSTADANFIVMELIDGISLKQYMEKKGVLNWKETLHFAMLIAKGLEHAHSRGIVHRDIKPHNVMVLKNGSVKVMDFGIARVMSKSNTLTKEALGSVHYISPEQAKGGHTDNRSDLYSLSVVMYEMMAGRPPYDGESPVAVAIQHINGGAARPSTFNPNIPGGMEQIILKGMALEIKDRYVSATEMLQDMEEFRKNPAITFDYHNILDDATRTIPVLSGKTLAEKAAQAKTGSKTGTSSDSIRLRQSGAAKRSPEAAKNAEVARRTAQNRATAQQQSQQERSRVATTAIVVCSAVAVISIIAFLVALFNGALLNREKELVDVPYLVGKVYDDQMAIALDEFNIHLQPQQYDDTYAKGQIMHQEPSGGSKVVKGSDLWITISLGQQPELETMDDVIGFPQDQVVSLLEGKGFKALIRMEASYVYEEGQVIRTDPAAGTELSPGQTIKLWVSTGPEIILKPMPNVVGLSLERAKELLEQQGFTNIVVAEVDSLRPEGEVVHQSVPKNEEVDVAAELVLKISKGPVETTEPEETDPPETKEEVTIVTAFLLPEREEAYVLSIFLDGSEVIESQEIKPGTTSFSIALTGSGTQVYDLYINGEYYRPHEVVFN